MSEYLIESPHTKEECLKALDEVLSSGPERLQKFEWGCTSGDHRGWATVSAENATDARKYIPSFIRDRASVTKVERFTPEQIRSYHSK